MLKSCEALELELELEEFKEQAIDQI